MIIIHLKGLLSEYIVMIKYFFSGYKILKHRYKSKIGEIDLIFRKNNLIVFCEVKSVSKNFDANINIVTSKQKSRLIKSSQNFLDKYYKNFPSRMDLVYVNFPSKIKIFENWIK